MPPFRLAGDDGHDTYATTLADALPYELIVYSCRGPRWLFVTARGSSFLRRATSDIDAHEVGRLLGVRYFLSGSIERVRGSTLHVSVELVDTRDGGVVWAERYEAQGDDVHQVRTDIHSQILAALELRTHCTKPRSPASAPPKAWTRGPPSISACSTCTASTAPTPPSPSKLFIEQAVGLDPRFARAHAGLSFVHFQAAFLRQTDYVAAEAALARRCAERGLELVRLDPFVNFTMGRTHWLTGDLGTAHTWLQRATTLSPNFAQGLYAQAWTETLAGQERVGREHVDLAMRL